MDVGGSFNRALERFKPNAAPLILGFFIVGAAIVLISVALNAVPLLVFGPGFLGSTVAVLLSSLAMMAIWGPLVGGLMTMAGKAYMGATPEIGDIGIAFNNGRLMEFIIAGAVINAPRLLSFVPIVGWPLSLLGSVATGFLFVFTMVMVAEGADARSALIRSKDMVLANVPTVILLGVVTFGLCLAGFCACIVGVFVAAPLVTLILVDTYFVLKNGPQPQGGVQVQPPQGYDPSGGGYPPQG
jgi:hypothetical protein